MPFEIIAALVVALAFFMQRLTGFGSAVIATPVLAMFWDPHESIALILIFQAAFGLWLVPGVWRRLLDPKLRVFQAFSIPAVIAFAYILPQIPGDIVRKGMAVVCVAVLVQWLLFSKLRLPQRWQTAAGGTGGLLSGAVQGAFGMGGPLFLLYYGSVEERASLIRDSSIAVFAVANVLRAPVALGTAQFTPAVLHAALLGALPFAAAMLIGSKLARKVETGIFRYLVMGILLIAAVQLALK